MSCSLKNSADKKKRGGRARKNGFSPEIDLDRSDDGSLKRIKVNIKGIEGNFVFKQPKDALDPHRLKFIKNLEKVQTSLTKLEKQCDQDVKKEYPTPDEGLMMLENYRNLPYKERLKLNQLSGKKHRSSSKPNVDNNCQKYFDHNSSKYFDAYRPKKINLNTSLPVKNYGSHGQPQNKHSPSRLMPETRKFSSKPRERHSNQ